MSLEVNFKILIKAIHALKNQVLLKAHKEEYPFSSHVPAEAAAFNSWFLPVVAPISLYDMLTLLFLGISFLHIVCLLPGVTDEDSVFLKHPLPPLPPPPNIVRALF